MKKARVPNLEKADAKRLVAWFQTNARDLPWRRDPKPYFVWLAEIMSQQTRMEVVVPYLARFLQRFPDIHALAAADEASVLSAWAGLGYYSRARNLHRAAKMIASNGAFPRTVEELRKLPGVGPYTAAAIASQCFGVAEPVWDGNVARVSARLARVKDPRAKSFQMASLDVLRALMTSANASPFNQGLMELGATICMPKLAHCDRCPLEGACGARAEGKPLAYPEPKRRDEKLSILARVQVRRKGARLFLAPRGEGQWFPGLWDFESELHGVRSPVKKLSGMRGRKVGEVKHSITKHAIRLEVWVDAQGGPARKDGKWFELDDLLSSRPPVPLATTAKKALKLLCSAEVF